MFQLREIVTQKVLIEFPGRSWQEASNYAMNYMTNNIEAIIPGATVLRCEWKEERLLRVRGAAQNILFLRSYRLEDVTRTLP